MPLAHTVARLGKHSTPVGRHPRRVPGGSFGSELNPCRNTIRHRTRHHGEGLTGAHRFEVDTRGLPAALMGRTFQELRRRRMLPLYAPRIEDLGSGDFVKVDCAACHHVALLTPEALLRAGLSPAAKVLDLKERLRCRGCGRKGRALVSIKCRGQGS